MVSAGERQQLVSTYQPLKLEGGEWGYSRPTQTQSAKICTDFWGGWYSRPTFLKDLRGGTQVFLAQILPCHLLEAFISQIVSTYYVLLLLLTRSNVTSSNSIVFSLNSAFFCQIDSIS